MQYFQEQRTRSRNRLDLETPSPPSAQDPQCFDGVGCPFNYKAGSLELLQNTKSKVCAQRFGLIGVLAERELFELLQGILLNDFNLSEEEPSIGKNLVKSHAGSSKTLFNDWTQSKWCSVRRLTISRSQQVANCGSQL